ncbi:DUF6415 family natural product biosynthesis protein [Streptomyces sp. NBC_01485]|uniref:DUF6415 family natural product biosynthesis protein n=1 Tax=Streptomyces sp. NBC_01485 TaxID=2903884 RepID=UPI002E3105C9|nr:DUF6415 family natural product biosynthesis protein [Streptomyces sp. NBC_01485]
MTSPLTQSVVPGVQIDAERIRETCVRVIWEPLPPSDEERTRLVGHLRGHIQLLLPEVVVRLPNLRGKWPKTADYVISRARAALDTDIAQLRSTCRMQSMATWCHSLLILHEQPVADAPSPAER